MMKKPLARALVLALCLLPSMARADGLSYDDPGVHFSAPADWTAVPVPQGQEGAPVAAFRKTFERYDTRVITLKIEKYDGSLEGLENSHESEVRQLSDSVFVDKRVKITLSNGMPAYQLRYTVGQDAGGTVRTMEYVVYDGKRSIIAGYSGRGGMFDDKDALDALSTLTVVLYPQGR